MRRKIILFFVFGLLVACYILAGLLGIQAHKDPGEMDTTAYLSAACLIQETGGVLHHIQNCFSGVYREGTQHPLYLLILSTVADHSVHFFVRAKIISFFIGLFFLFVYFFSVKKMFGDATALLGLCFLVAAATLINMSTMVACESLLVVFFLLFWFFTSRGFKKRKYWLVAGFFAAAAFLTKSIAILTLPVFLFSTLFSSGEKLKIFRNRFFWGFFAVFFLVSSPLLVRNVKVFGTPLYSDSSVVLWLDSWHEYYSTGIKQNPPTVFSYLKSHSPAQISKTVLRGFFYRLPKMISDGLKPVAFWEKEIDLNKLQGYHQKTAPWQGVWALVLFALCLTGLWKKKKEPATAVAAISMALFFILAAWYSKIFPGDPPTRLIYPVLFFVYIYALLALQIFLSRWGRWMPAVAGIFAVAYLAFLGTHFEWKDLNIKKSYTFTYPFAAELLWVNSHLHSGDKFMAGDIFKGYYFYFEPLVRGTLVPWPRVDSMEELVEYSRKESIQYAVLEMSTVAYNLKVYKDYFYVGPWVGLQATKNLPPPFKSIFKDPKRTPLYEIYQFNDVR